MRLTNCRRPFNILLPRPQKGLFECVADVLTMVSKKPVSAG